MIIISPIINLLILLRTVKRHKNTIKQINTKKLINNFSEKYINLPLLKIIISIKIISENSYNYYFRYNCICILVVGIYFYFRQGDSIKRGKTFYGNDLLSYQPLFKMELIKLNPCIERCQIKFICSGITFNKDDYYNVLELTKVN